MSTCPSYSTHASPPTAKIENEGLIIHSKEPFNAEPPLDRLRATYITAQNGVYVRSHGAIPVLDPAKHTMRAEGLNTPLALSVDDMRTRLLQRSVTATLQCAGNRRADMHVTRATSDPRLDAMPVTSAICEPAPRARLRVGPARVRGYAMASYRSIVRVNVSGDGGRTWQQAELAETSGPPSAGTFWTATIDLASGEQELAKRARDSAGQTQPALPDDTWNFKGYLSARLAPGFRRRGLRG